jgi:MOSC domain-containing protein YiiM
VQTIAGLKAQFAQPGKVDWIGISVQRNSDIQVMQSVEVRMPTGIVGDHHAMRGNSKRQVTLVQAEHLDVVASLVGRESIGPELLRRNVVVRGINLLALKDQEFLIGTAVLRGSGLCVPCSRMERNLGRGGYNAMRGHGGINAIVVQEGIIAVGDAVVLQNQD